MKNISSLSILSCVLVLMVGCHSDRDKDATSDREVTIPMPYSVVDQVSKLGTERHYDEAMRILRPYAEKGDPDAEFGMATGLILKGGEKGAEKENPEVLKWVRDAAARGHLQSLSFLSEAYRFGKFGLPKDDKMAGMWKSCWTNEDMIPKCFEYEKKHLHGN